MHVVVFFEKRNKVLFIFLVLLWRKDMAVVRRWNFILVLKQGKIPDFNFNWFILLFYFFLLFPSSPLSLFLLLPSYLFFFFGILPSHVRTFHQDPFVSKQITSSRNYYLILPWRKITWFSSKIGIPGEPICSMRSRCFRRTMGLIQTLNTV